MSADEWHDEREIVETVNYLASVFIPSINRINDAAYNGKPSRLAARLLITDTPAEWRAEITDKLKFEDEAYQLVRKRMNPLLATGTTLSQKVQAQKELIEAEQNYSMNVKDIIVTLLNQKIGLFKTRKAVEQGEYFSLYQQMGLEDAKEDD